MDDQLLRRLEGLSAEKRQLFERLLTNHGKQSSPVHPASSGSLPQHAAERRALRLPDALEETSVSRLSDPNEAARRSQLPRDVKRDYRQIYNSISEQLDSSPVGKHAMFCNFGYAADGSPQYSPVVLPEDILNRNTIRLVLEVIGDCPLGNCRVLDVGCGRGGTVSVITTFFDAQHVIGLDLSAAAVRFCRRSQVSDRVVFLEGDAEDLPFQPSSFDVVSNVESSHSYPNLRSFYREVSRVLKVGGYFLYTDLFSRDQWWENVEGLRASGFTVERDRDITANVALSCELTAGGKLDAYNPRNNPEFMGNFLGTPDSDVYRLMKTRAWTYRILRLRNAGAEDRVDLSAAADARSSDQRSRAAS